MLGHQPLCSWSNRKQPVQIVCEDYSHIYTSTHAFGSIYLAPPGRLDLPTESIPSALSLSYGGVAHTIIRVSEHVSLLRSIKKGKIVRLYHILTRGFTRLR